MARLPRPNSSFSFIFILICLSSYATESRPPFACDPSNAMTKTFPFCSVSLHIRDRVKDLIGRLTLKEKIGLLVNDAAPVERLGIKGFQWGSEALHGVTRSPGIHFGGEFQGVTRFPQVITTAASFNASLWEEIGRVVSDEARAMYNGGVTGLTFWSPNVNIFRDPRWGRGQETPGEDPVVAAKYAASYVKGLQSPVGYRLKVAACCKHYTANDLHQGNDVSHFNAKVNKQDIEDTYNVPFKACVLEGRGASVMCSHNQVNGKSTCTDPALLRGTIRGRWRFKGFVISDDCDSHIDSLLNQQHYNTTSEDEVVAPFIAGLDLDCGPFRAIYTEKAISAGKLSEADVDDALANTITVEMRLGMFDGTKQPYSNLGPKDLCTSAHRELALEAAHQGIVLLHNRARSLPLSTTRHRTIAVIGPNSDATETMLGNHAAGNPCGYTSPLQGIGRYARTIHQAWCDTVACNSNKQFEGAEAAARTADATVLVMGLDQSMEAEGRDRSGLLLPGLQQELVSGVAKASRGPTILVLMSGSPIDVTFAKNDPSIAAILWAGYPGQAGGAAVADIIFGTKNPGAKLPMTWYPHDYVDKVPMTDMDMRADTARGYPGRTYRFYKGPVVFPFGFGLSYTNFRVTLANAPKTVSVHLARGNSAFKNTTLLNNAVRVSHSNCDAMTLGIQFDVKNVGEMDGSHTLLIFSTPPPPAVKWAPEKQLVAFEKVHLLAGAQQRIRVHIDVCKHLSVVDKSGIRRIPLGAHSLQIGDLQHSISLQAAVEEIQS